MTKKEWIKDIVIAVIIALVIVQFIKPTIVKQTSMKPNFVQNDYLFAYKMAYKFGGQPKKGDVVIFKSDLETDDGSKKLLIKRVIGLPGDRIKISEGEVYINGKKDDQSYTFDGYTDGEVDAEIPEGCLFCMGDNRLDSIDSRAGEVGMVPLQDVVGKVVFRAFPFAKFGPIHNPYDEASK